MKSDTLLILNQVKSGKLTPEQAELQLKKQPFVNMGYATLDTQREQRCGAGEVVFGAGKTAEQIAGIIRRLHESGQSNVLITRLDAEKAKAVSELENIEYYSQANLAISGCMPAADSSGTILVVTGGTSDIPVAEEAALTAEFLGNRVQRLYDVGVAGLHRLLSNLDMLLTAKVIIAVAGMEGALASVVGGLVSCPVIAVPTSVGYGASFGGFSALLSMLNSCASGVSVVNIDNGFGAGYQASLINHIGE